MNILVALLTLVGIGLIGLTLAGTRARRRLTVDHPPPGRVVDIGGYRLYLTSEGVGTPTVVIDAGAGDFSASWALVQPAVATFGTLFEWESDRRRREWTRYPDRST